MGDCTLILLRHGESQWNALNLFTGWVDVDLTDKGRTEAAGEADSLLDPDAIAQTYMAVLKQPRSAWSLEVELRPWVEKF